MRAPVTHPRPQPHDLWLSPVPNASRSGSAGSDWPSSSCSEQGPRASCLAPVPASGVTASPPCSGHRRRSGHCMARCLGRGWDSGRITLPRERGDQRRCKGRKDQSRVCWGPARPQPGALTLVQAEGGRLGALTPKPCLSQRNPLSRTRLKGDGSGWQFRSDHSPGTKGCQVSPTRSVLSDKTPLG